jgi:SAM-dependent methyltransferase
VGQIDRALARLRGKLHRGASSDESRWCPLCEQGSAQFLPYGGHKRPDVRCPQCGSAERHRLIWLYLTRYSRSLKHPPRLLHMAPEKCLTLKLQPAAAQYVTLDLYASGVDVQADITKPIPLDDGAFDLILCSHLLEHVDDDAFAMRELVRLTAPDGECLVLTPIDPHLPTAEDLSITDPAERTRLYGQSDHVRLYGLDVIDRLTSAGFDVESFVANEHLEPAEIQRMRLEPLERLLVCRPTR